MRALLAAVALLCAIAGAAHAQSGSSGGGSFFDSGGGGGGGGSYDSGGSSYSSSNWDSGGSSSYSSSGSNPGLVESRCGTVAGGIESSFTSISLMRGFTHGSRASMAFWCAASASANTPCVAIW